jgi:hypothetical protein
MIKRYVIFLFLATAYSVLLAHNFTPHHHMEERARHDHEHQHHDVHNEDDSEESDHSNPFQYFDHIGSTEAQYIPVLNSPNQSFQKQVNASAFLKVLAVIISHFEKPPLVIHRAREDDPFLSQSLPYFFPLKAPPASFIA